MVDNGCFDKIIIDIIALKCMYHSYVSGKEKNQREATTNYTHLHTFEMKLEISLNYFCAQEFIKEKESVFVKIYNSFEPWETATFASLKTLFVTLENPRFGFGYIEL